MSTSDGSYNVAPMDVDMPPKPARLGENIRTYRRARGLTGAQLAEALGTVGPATVSRWETGKEQPTGDNRRRLPIVLHVPFHILYPPELVADRLPLSQRVLLLSAHRLRYAGTALFIEAHPSDAATARGLARLWLIEDAGSRNGLRQWRLTGPGEETLDALRDGQ